MVFPSADFLNNLSENFKSYLLDHNYIRIAENGNLVVAPTFGITRVLMFILVDGVLPDPQTCRQRNPASLGDACIVNTSTEKDKKFKPPPPSIHKISVTLCLESALKANSSLYIVQGTEACLHASTIATKFPEELLRKYLTQDQINLILNPMGRTSERSSFKWGPFHDNSNVFFNMPSATNMVAYNTHAVSLELRLRLAESTCVMMYF